MQYVDQADSINEPMPEKKRDSDTIVEEKSQVSSVSPVMADSQAVEVAVAPVAVAALGEASSETASAAAALDKEATGALDSSSPVVSVAEDSAGNSDKTTGGVSAKRVLAKRREKIAQAAAASGLSASPKASQEVHPEEAVSQKVSSAPKRTTSEEDFLNQAYHEAVSNIDVVEPESVKKVKETLVNKSTDRAAAVVFADPPLPPLPKAKSRPRMIGSSDFKRICQILVIFAISIANGKIYPFCFLCYLMLLHQFILRFLFSSSAWV
jgi:hypothetical protein